MSEATTTEMPNPLTPQHELLRHFAGVWDVKTVMWMGPDSEPMESTAVETNTLKMGGLWMLSEFDGTAGTMPFEGFGQIGYDPFKQKYVGTWIDSMASVVTTMEGDYDARNDRLTYINTGTNPQTGQPHRMRSVIDNATADQKVMTFHEIDDEGNDLWKMMELHYTRRS